jgi:hypothetical protein
MPSAAVDYEALSDADPTALATARDGQALRVATRRNDQLCQLVEEKS